MTNQLNQTNHFLFYDKNSLIDGVDLDVQHYTGFGGKWIKENRMSPDCFIQLALQIVFYKMYGKLTSTYESGSLRRFKYGRVDNIRANTNEALILARALCGELPDTSVSINKM